MLTQLKVYHQLFQLTKKQRVKILVQLSELLQKYMIIYVFYMPVLEDQYVQRMGLKLHLKLLSKWWTKLWHIQKKVDYKYLLQLFQVEKERSEEHTSELQSRGHLVCRLLLEKQNRKI